ncbi:MAG: hypothetical protein JWN52_2852 [Actinomycetia bacterium]|nr:hypothetical protein [Actinomycetes bacterium]
MGQPRPPESFPRVYSPPEAPSTARRSAFVGVLTAVLAFGLAGLAVFFLSSAFDGKPSQSRPTGAAPQQPASGEPPAASPAISPTPEGTPSPSATPTTRSASPVGGQPFVRLPPVCSTPPEATSIRLVPSPRITTKSSNTTVTTCTVVSTSGSRPSLHVETYLFPPRDGGDPVKDAAGLLSSDWTQAHQNDGQAKTVILERHPGLGDEAFHWYKTDKGQPVVVGEVEARLRNAVVRVAYSRDAPAKAGDQAVEKRLLDEAAAVARQTIRAFA